MVKTRLRYFSTPLTMGGPLFLCIFSQTIALFWPLFVIGTG
jgi:hypothetical protein